MKRNTSSGQARTEMKAEQKREKERRKNAKNAKEAQEKGDTDAKYSHLLKKKKRERGKARREKDHREFE